jgi:hypothetical protein
MVMVRGRSRGLPVAIDRAVMLPPDFSRTTSINANVDGNRNILTRDGENQHLETIPEKAVI